MRIKLNRLVAFIVVLLCSHAMLVAQTDQQRASVNNPVQKLQIAEMAISRLYVDSVDENKLVEEGIRSMLKMLDPHSTYSTPKETKRLNEPLQAQFDGIGVQFQMLDDTLFVIETINGGPSEKVGILPGDRIVTVDGQSIAGCKLLNDSIISLLRGQRGTIVNVEVLRRGEAGLLPFSITRDKIPVHSIDAAYMADKGIGYVRISRFAGTTPEEFMQAVEKLRKEGMKDIIIDVESNGGGYLQAVVKMAGELFAKAQNIVYTEGRVQPRYDFNSEGNGSLKKARVVIIVNEYSASASEILAGAVQDWDRGLIVGRRTYGKGLVQRPIELPDGSMIRLTTARYYTPSGRSIQKPYSDGDRTNYDKDIEERLAHGELSFADSIHLNDSLRYETRRMKRAVYGGGGIMPDVFVPVDTTWATPLYRRLNARGLIIKWATQYVEQHREELKQQWKGGFAAYDKNFTMPPASVSHLKAIASEANIEWSEEQERASLTTFEIQLKGIIARNLWGMTEYYSVLNRFSKPYLESIAVLQDGRYDAILKP